MTVPTPTSDGTMNDNTILLVEDNPDDVTRHSGH